MFEDEERAEGGMWNGRVRNRDTGTARNAASCVKRFNLVVYVKPIIA